jgi:DNA polymerase-1
MPETLYLIDGHALAYRTYFALTLTSSGSRWQTSSGEPTAGVYGFASVLLRILGQDGPDYLAVAFDTGRTFRDKIYPEYKGTREKMGDDLRPQIKRIRQLVDTFNIPRLEMEGYEADDVLGSVARQAVAQGLGVKIITGDRDLLQLVGERIIVNLAGNKLSEAKDFADADQVREYFGVPPSQVVDYKALVGDKSDNIPGVPGVGEKTAQELYNTYATLDEIYANLESIPPRVKNKLEAGRDSAYMSRELALIRTDLPVRLDLAHARADDWDLATVEALFDELEFRSLLQRLEGLKKGAEVPRTPAKGKGGKRPPATEAASADTAETPAAVYTQRERGQLAFFEAPAPVIQPPPPPANLAYHVVRTADELAALGATLSGAEAISFDTETTSTQEMQAELVGISLAVRPGEGWYIPVGHRGAENLPLQQVIDTLRGPMTDPRIPKLGHHAKYDYLVLARHGLRPSPLAFDSMLAEWLIDPATRNLGLKNLVHARLGDEMTHIEDLIGKGRNQLTMADVPVEAAAAYAAADAETVVRLRPILLDELGRVGAVSLLNDLEMPLVSVLAEMELAGVLLDRDFFSGMSVELGQRMAQIETQVYEMIGRPFNINSTQQLSDVLFKTLALEPPDRGRKTASGHYSTSADILELLRGKHPVVDLVLEHRELSKLKSTYLDALPAAADPQTGRVHTSYGQTGAITGRLSSSNPNLQNIPTRGSLGRRVRNGFIAAPGHILLSVDYSQIELRIVAHMAQDEAMLGAFRDGQDIHAATAAAIYNIPLEQVSKDQRRHAKAINFGLIYGMSPFGLTRSTDLTLAEAEAFVKAYFQRFPGVKGYLDGTRKLAASQGYTETLLGRRRYFPALKGQMSQALRNREEREAINSPVQGTAADIMKLAMLRIPPALKEAGLGARMLLQVHDEIVLECPQPELEATSRLVQQVMSEAYPLVIPLSTESRWGYNWGEMQVME